MMLWLHIIGVRDRLSQGGQSEMLLLEFYATPQLKKVITPRTKLRNERFCLESQEKCIYYSSF